jgi:hypothetical protein
VATTVITIVGGFFKLVARCVRFVSRGARRLRSRRPRKRSPESASAD